MPANDTHPSPEQLARLAADVFERQVRHRLRPEDDGKFVAIDLNSGDFEVDDDDYSAVTRCRDRLP